MAGEARGTAMDPSSAKQRFWSRGPDVIANLFERLAAGGFDVRPAGEVALHDTYLDTHDGWLYRAGAACRLRTGGSRTTLLLEPLKTTRGVTAEEFEETLSEPPAGFPGRLPGKVLSARLLPLMGDVPFEVRLEFERKQATYHVSTSEGAPFEIDVDVVEVVSGIPVGSLTEVTLRAPAGVSEEAQSLAGRLVLELGFENAVGSSLRRGLEVAGIQPAMLVEGEELVLQPTDRFVDAAYRVLRRHFHRMLWNEPGTRLGLDPERLHDMRVATRRLRAALKVFAGGLPPRRVRGLLKGLKWIGGALGEVRDLDVYSMRLSEETRDIVPELLSAIERYRRHLESRLRKARETMLRTLGTRGYAAFADAFRRFLEAGPPKRPRTPVARRPVTVVASELIRQKLNRVMEQGRSLGPEATDVQLHRLRIRCKQLRYVCEFFVDLFGPPTVKLARRVTELQDVLGAHQDAVVARETLARNAGAVSAPRAERRGLYMAMGHLMAQHTQRARLARTRFAKLWKRFDRKKVRKPLKMRLVKPVRVGGRVRKPSPPQACGE